MMIVLKRFKYLLVLLLGVFAIVTPLATLAQSSTQVFINYPEISEGPSAISTGLFFNILDANEQIVTDAKIESAAIHLGDGSVYEASFEQPTSQAYVTLVLDSSGSMSTAMPLMRQAAIQAVENAPDEADFAVIQFNSRVTLIQDFTPDRRQAAEKIEGLQAFGGTCLYDGLYRGLELLDGAPRGRRAIILFTDGNDATAQGTPCSQHTYSEVIDYASAQTPRVPIHTIGLSSGQAGGINADELRELASTTGGFAEIGEQNSLSLLFQKIINGLSNQWLARADVYPKAGDNTAWVSIRFEDGTQLESSPVTFLATRDYIAPPGAKVSSISYTSTGDVIFNLDLTGADRIGNFLLQVIDVRANIPAPAFSAEVTNELEVAATNFESGNEYQIVIIGQDSVGQDLFKTSYELRYDPVISEGELAIVSIQLNSDVPKFDIVIRASNLEGVSHYDAWLIDSETNIEVEGSRIVVEPGSLINMPLEGISNGTYLIKVTAVSLDGQVLAEINSDETVFKVGLFKKLGNSQVILVLLVVVIAGGLAFVAKTMYLDPRRAQKRSVLLKNTLSRMEAVQGDDDWDEDSVKVMKRRGRESGVQREAPRVQPVPSSKPTVKPEVPPVSSVPPQPLAQMPDARLIVEQSPDDAYNGNEYVITESPFTIGRKSGHLELKLSGVSRTHAVILFRNGQFIIRDDGSTNGTAVDGEHITGRGEIPLGSGVRISMGKNLWLRFEIREG